MDSLSIEILVEVPECLEALAEVLRVHFLVELVRRQVAQQVGHHDVQTGASGKCTILQNPL